MEDILNKYLSGKIEDYELIIKYHTGNSFLGETFFELKGDGSYKLWSTVTRKRRKREFTGNIDKKLVIELVEIILKKKIWEIKHINPNPADDDAEAIISVQEKNNVFSAVLWISEIRNVEEFKEVINVIIKIIRDISHNKILESGF